MQSKGMLIGLMVASLAGCATIGSDAAKPDYQGQLYEGRSVTTFGTQLPLASAQEGEVRGDQARREGDQDRALFEYIRSLKLDGNNPRVLYKIGQIHAARNNSALAESAFRRALAIDAEYLPAHQELGLLLLSSRRYDEAKQHLTRAVEAGESAWRAHNGLGVIADLDGDHSQASHHFRQALSSQPRSPMLLNNLGYSRYLAGDWQAALDAFNRALSHDQTFERAWRNIGLVYARRGEYRRALDAFTRVMDEAAAYNNLGYICMSEGNYRLAESYFRKAIRASPTYYVAAHDNLAKARGLLAQTAGGAR